MKDKEYLVFVYGTLLVGESNHHVAKPHLVHVEEGSIRGYLHDVGPYPALLLDENGGIISGEWFTVTEEGLARMDELEDYQEGRESNHYDRVLVKDRNKNLEGFVYVYNQEQIEGLPRITSGSWRNRLLNR
ncbi:gamma-glutamylcyclotransferase [Bacillus sp. PS06]|uniref:gamma-glutamylcyclotransferase family protein n=1 Tax=Bacillus sp. PS06 TaxID=2764176 RepID=UPI00177F7D5E|nr:gamma-glutamylcyclotransferase family protein [Bacillus sp. PS06]MBD8067350.1 gamma-glutamylcyclotransferase [Bacillus sp. PS06]